MPTKPLKPYRLWQSEIEKANYPKPKCKPPMTGLTQVNSLTGTIVRIQPSVSDLRDELNGEFSRNYWEGVRIRQKIYRDQQ